jgi:hypothetical protein
MTNALVHYDVREITRNIKFFVNCYSCLVYLPTERPLKGIAQLAEV